MPLNKITKSAANNLIKTTSALCLSLIKTLPAKKAAKTGNYDAVICLGAVIRGETPHFDFVASEASKGIALAGLETGVPIIFGVITTDTVEQAINRAGTTAGNRGFDAALTAIEMSNLMGKIGA